MTHTLIIPSRLPGLNEIIAAMKERSGKWNRCNDTSRPTTLEIVENEINEYKQTLPLHS